MGLQVRVLELEKTLEAERVRLGELRKQHYVLAGVVGTPGEEEPGRPSPAPHSGTSKKPPLAQKPSVAPRQDHQVPGISAGAGRGLMGGRLESAVLASAPGSVGHVAMGESQTTEKPQQEQKCCTNNMGNTAGGRALLKGKMQGPGEVGCMGAWPCPLSPSPLTPAARQKGWHLPGSTCELLGPQGVQQGGWRAGLGLTWLP